MSKILQRAAADNKKRLLEAEANDATVSKKKMRSEVSANISLKKPSKGTSLVKKSEATIDDSAVVYIGHIPHGFYEKQMRRFFSQFGDVVKLKLYRSKKTGNSKGYAFVQFESNDIAKVVSEAMNGYFLFDRKLVSNVIPVSKIHEGMFLPQKRKTTGSKSSAGEVEDEDADEEENPVIEDDSEKLKKRATQFLRSQSKKMEHLKALGIDFDLFLPSAEE
eukprot:gene2330-4534_t